MRYDVKELILVILFAIINMFISFIITSVLHIYNIVLFQSIASNMTVTYEVIIWFVLGVIEVWIYEKIARKKDEA